MWLSGWSFFRPILTFCVVPHHKFQVCSASHNCKMQQISHENLQFGSLCPFCTAEFKLYKRQKKQHVKHLTSWQPVKHLTKVMSQQPAKQYFKLPAACLQKVQAQCKESRCGKLMECSNTVLTWLSGHSGTEGFFLCLLQQMEFL